MSREEQEHGPAPSPASSHEHPAYLRAARFGGEKPAARAYRQAQDLLFATPDCELSAFRFHLDRLSHVAVLGNRPPGNLDRQLRTILSRGEPASLPEEDLTQLQQRRSRATQLGPWMEGHYRP